MMQYPSDVSDKGWMAIKDFFRRPDARGKRAKYPLRQMVNAIPYVARTGCQWRYLPSDFPPWWAVYKRFERWNRRGVWERALDALNHKARMAEGRRASPSLSVIDSQSVKTVYASEERGYDGGKKGEGKKADDRSRYARASAGGEGMQCQNARYENSSFGMRAHCG